MRDNKYNKILIKLYFSISNILIFILVFPGTNSMEEENGMYNVIVIDYSISFFITMHWKNQKYWKIYLIISDTLKGCSMSTIDKCYGIRSTNGQKVKKLIEVSLCYIIKCML